MSWKQLAWLEEIINDKLTIGNTLNDLDDELKNNTWTISINTDERKTVTEDDLLEFFTLLMRNRHEQISNKSKDHGMHFYVWYDRQASQLRFSVISDFHDELPFKVKIKQVDLKDIIHEFFQSKDLIPFDDLEIVEINDVNQNEVIANDKGDFILSVYQTHLTPIDIYMDK